MPPHAFPFPIEIRPLLLHPGISPRAYAAALIATTDVSCLIAPCVCVCVCVCMHVCIYIYILYGASFRRMRHWSICELSKMLRRHWSRPAHCGPTRMRNCKPLEGQRSRHAMANLQRWSLEGQHSWRDSAVGSWRSSAAPLRGVCAWLVRDHHGPTREATPSATRHVLPPIVRSAPHHRRRRPRWGTAAHGAEPGRRGRSSAQRCSAPAAGRLPAQPGQQGHGGSCPTQRDQASSTADPNSAA